MKRTISKQIKKADAILTADWHLQEKTPVARTDNFWETQWRKIDFISELQKEHDCPVLHSGDLFDYWKPSPMFLSESTLRLPDKFYSVIGNHDMPQHNLELQNKSGIYNLWINRKIDLLHCCHFGQKPEQFDNESSLIISDKKILVWHVMTYKNEAPFPGCEESQAKKLLKKYPDYDLIVTGDNHTPFIEEYKGRLLVNPGSIFRLTAGQIEHKPRVYLWYADANTVEPVYIPIEENVISREHLDIIEQRNERINQFVNALKTDWKIGLSFEENLERIKNKNKIEDDIMQIIYKSLD